MTPKCRATKPAVTISQLLMLNYHEKAPKGNIVRQKRDREPPLPVYVGLSVYGKDRDKSRIEELHDLGASISYNRVNEITSQLCRKVTVEATRRNVLCPPNLKHGIFPTAAIDNIDHNPSSTTSSGQGFHGTGISLFQLRTDKNQETPQENSTQFVDVECPGDRSVPDLPDFYANVPVTSASGSMGLASQGRDPTAILVHTSLHLKSLPRA